MSAATLPILFSAFLLASTALLPQPALSDTHSDCGVAQTAFSFCVSYLSGRDGNLSPKCCEGVKIVHDMAPTPADQREACTCLKEVLVAAGVTDSDGGMARRAKEVRATCGVDTKAIPTSLSESCDE